jgi:hypothetical protein
MCQTGKVLGVVIGGGCPQIDGAFTKVRNETGKKGNTPLPCLYMENFRKAGRYGYRDPNHPSANLAIDWYIEVRREGSKKNFENSLLPIVEEFDKQNGRQYTLYSWDFTYAGSGHYKTVFYYYKTNGRIRIKFLIDKIESLIAWGGEIIVRTNESDYYSYYAILGRALNSDNGDLDLSWLRGYYMIAFDAFRNNNIPNVILDSYAIGIKEGAFANSNITSVTAPSLLNSQCRKAFTGNPIKNITIIPQELIWPSGFEPRGGGEPEAYFEDYLDEFFYRTRDGGTYTWDGSKWSFKKTEIPGDFFGKNSNRSPGLYTWENGGWSYKPRPPHFGSTVLSYFYDDLPAPGIYKWENNTWVFYQWQ